MSNAISNKIKSIDDAINKVNDKIDKNYRDVIKPLQLEIDNLYKERRKVQDTCNHILSKNKKDIRRGDGCHYSKCIICNTSIMVLADSVFEQ